MSMSVSERSQTIILWWALAFVVIFGLAWWYLLKMVPPPPPSLSAAEVAAFYLENASSIKLGAVIASWTSAYMVPFSAVVAIQIARLEEGKPVWAVLSFGSGCMMSMWLVFPPMLWGIAAFDPTRSAEITSTLNQMANLSLVTTDQYYIFQMIAIAVVGLRAKADPNTAFPRWLCYLTLWIGILFEVGALSFMFKSGPFAWNGLFVFWLPICALLIWLPPMFYCMFRALKRQSAAAHSN